MKYYASLRLDISFYMDWFCQRLHDGFFDVEIDDKTIHRYNLEEAEEFILFTRNPVAVYKYKDVLKKYPVKLVTFISLYDGFFEPNIKNKASVIDCIRKSKGFCENYFGYGPIFYTPVNDKEWHLAQFKYLCSGLYKKVSGVYVDFEIGLSCQENKKLAAQKVNPEDILPELKKIAKSYGLTLYVKPTVGSLEKNELDMGITNACPLLCEYCPNITNRIAANARHQYCSPENPLIYGIQQKKQKVIPIITGEVPVQQSLFDGLL